MIWGMRKNTHPVTFILESQDGKTVGCIDDKSLQEHSVQTARIHIQAGAAELNVSFNYWSLFLADRSIWQLCLGLKTSIRISTTGASQLNEKDHNAAYSLSLAR